MAAKFDRAKQMLKRLTFNATFHQFAQRREFRFGQHTLEFQISAARIGLDRAGDADVRGAVSGDVVAGAAVPGTRRRQAPRVEQVLGVQPRALDVILFEIRSRRLQYFKHGHRFCHVERSRDISKFFCF